MKIAASIQVKISAGRKSCDMPDVWLLFLWNFKPFSHFFDLTQIEIEDWHEDSLYPYLNSSQTVIHRTTWRVESIDANHGFHETNVSTCNRYFLGTLLSQGLQRENAILKGLLFACIVYEVVNAIDNGPDAPFVKNTKKIDKTTYYMVPSIFPFVRPKSLILRRF